jgi:7,8-dihydro-6-hydroxymethylpterin-pyrophosphokinase
MYPTCPRRIYGNGLATMTVTTEYEVYEAANMTAQNSLQFLNHLSDAETETTTRSLADT